MEAQKERSKPRNAVQTGTAWPTNFFPCVYAALTPGANPNPSSLFAQQTTRGRRYYNWLVMSSADNPTLRPWQEIARELARQTDYRKIGELSHELNQALEKQVGEKWQDYLKSR
jgi:hypothetical protein